MRSFDQRSHEGSGLMFQVRLGSRIGAGMNPAFQVAAQVLVGVQLQGIGGEIEDNDLVFVLLSHSATFLP